MNIPYEMFLTIQPMHLNCRKDRLKSPTSKEGCDLFRRTSDDSSRKKMKNNMMNATTSLMQNQEEREDQFNKNDV